MADEKKVEIKALTLDSLRPLIHETVKETLTGLGFDTSRPTETQADILYLRRWRRGSEEARRIVAKSMLTVIASGLLYLLWEAVRRKL